LLANPTLVTSKLSTPSANAHQLTNHSVPYIADAMHNASDTTYYNLDSIMIYDPSVSYDVITNDIPSVPFVDYWSGLFSFNATFMDHLHEKWESCGYADFYEQALTFPPKGVLPSPPNVGGNRTDCSLWVSSCFRQHIVVCLLTRF
jgi:carboxypeptidase D